VAQDKLAETLAKIRSKFGETAIRKASEMPELIRVPVNVIEFDRAIGGGVPRGRIVLLVGYESTGKSTVTERAIAQVQARCRFCHKIIPEYYRFPRIEVDEETGELIPKFETAADLGIDFGDEQCRCENPEPGRALLADVEGTYDPFWGFLHGVDNDRLELFQPDYEEALIDVVEAVIRSGGIDIVVVDSLAAVSPAEEIVKSAESGVVGVAARLNNKLMRLIVAAFNGLNTVGVTPPAVIIVNQLREKVGVLFGNPETIPGGHGQRFHASITVRMSAKSSGKVEVGPKNAKEVIGRELEFEVRKNKTAPPHRFGSFTVYTEDVPDLGYRKGYVDNGLRMARMGLDLGFVSRSKGIWTYTGKYGTVSGAGEEEFAKNLEANQAVYWELYRKILGAPFKVQS